MNLLMETQFMLHSNWKETVNNHTPTLSSYKLSVKKGTILLKSIIIKVSIIMQFFPLISYKPP